MSARDTASESNLVGRDLFCGISAAIAKMISGNPFETIKVRRQTWTFDTVSKSTQDKHGLGQIIRQTFRKEGITGFYKGLTPNIPGLFAYNSILFASYGSFSRILNRDSTQLTVSQVALAGAGTGLMTPLVITPVELIRCRLQADSVPRSLFPKSASVLHPKSTKPALLSNPRGIPSFTGPFEVIRSTVNTNGIRGLYKGFNLTVLREVPGNLVYFGTYEAIIRGLGYATLTSSGKNMSSNAAPPWLVLIAGGCAGAANWTVVYPIDTIKSRMQTDCMINPQYRNTLDCVLKTIGFRDGHGVRVPFSWKIWQQISGLFNGLTPCVTRGFVANAAGFLAIDASRQAWTFLFDQPV